VVITRVDGREPTVSGVTSLGGRWQSRHTPTEVPGLKSCRAEGGRRAAWPSASRHSHHRVDGGQRCIRTAPPSGATTVARCVARPPRSPPPPRPSPPPLPPPVALSSVDGAAYARRLPRQDSLTHAATHTASTSPRPGVQPDAWRASEGGGPRPNRPTAASRRPTRRHRRAASPSWSRRTSGGETHGGAGRSSSGWCTR
jgi:hypothetical protein